MWPNDVLNIDVTLFYYKARMYRFLIFQYFIKIWLGAIYSLTQSLHAVWGYARRVHKKMRKEGTVTKSCLLGKKKINEIFVKVTPGRGQNANGAVLSGG